MIRYEYDVSMIWISKLLYSGVYNKRARKGSKRLEKRRKVFQIFQDMFHEFRCQVRTYIRVPGTPEYIIHSDENPHDEWTRNNILSTIGIGTDRTWTARIKRPPAPVLRACCQLHEKQTGARGRGLCCTPPEGPPRRTLGGPAPEATVRERDACCMNAAWMCGDHSYDARIPIPCVPYI